MNPAAVNKWSRWWQTLRSLSGDDRYERYVEHLRSHHPGSELPTRARFYASELERRWNRDGPTRCC
ncbi:MAG TPA: YbdD/YjiX family protein [Steroidobacteraceae bacterium]|nr:YbdD/YjiX family protein [Steroidobacteraceae bacterium]